MLFQEIHWIFDIQRLFARQISNYQFNIGTYMLETSPVLSIIALICTLLLVNYYENKLLSKILNQT